MPPVPVCWLCWSPGVPERWCPVMAEGGEGPPEVPVDQGRPLSDGFLLYDQENPEERHIKTTVTAYLDRGDTITWRVWI